MAGRLIMWFALTVTLSAGGGASAQDKAIDAVTVGGDKVRLLPDGRWEWAEGTQAAQQRREREAAASRDQEVRQAELRRERGAQGGGLIGMGRTLHEGDKDYNRGSLNPKMR